MRRIQYICCGILVMVLAACGTTAVPVFESAVVPTRAPIQPTLLPTATPLTVAVVSSGQFAGFGVAFPPSEGEMLQIGDTATGTLSDEAFARLHRFEAQSGEIVDVTVAQQSGNLDTYLILLNPDGSELARNDDSDDNNTDSALHEISLPVSGTYTVVATRWRQRYGTSGGDYRVSVQPSDGEETPSQTAQAIAYDSTISAELTDDITERTYTFSGERGDLVQVSVAADGDSDLDPYLTVTDSVGNELANNDDINPVRNYNSAVTVALPYTGSFTVVIELCEVCDTSDVGAYVLSVQQTGRVEENVHYAYLDADQSRSLLDDELGLLTTGFYAGDLVNDDADYDVPVQTILTFYLPPLTDATVSRAELLLNECDQEGFGFESTGRIAVYSEILPRLSAALPFDTEDGTLVGSLEACGTVNVTTVIEDAYADDAPTVQFRLVAQDYDDNEQDDNVVFLNPTLVLTTP